MNDEQQMDRHTHHSHDESVVSPHVAPLPSQLQPAPGSTPCLELVELSKTYGTTTVLDRVSLQVHTGEVLSIIGPSGAGKSTVIRCINFLEVPTSGRLYLNGRLLGWTDSANRTRPWRERQFQELRREVGMVFQSFNLFPHLRVDQNIMLAQMKALGRSKVEARERAEALLDRVGLAHKSQARPAELSGGEQQRVAIARALALDPKALLFDEPTSALDPEVRMDVLNVMQQLAQDGMTMIVVTHELGFASRVSDRVCFLDRGRVAEEGPPDRVLKDPDNERTRQFLKAVLA